MTKNVVIDHCFQDADSKCNHDIDLRIDIDEHQIMIGVAGDGTAKLNIILADNGLLTVYPSGSNILEPGDSRKILSQVDLLQWF